MSSEVSLCPLGFCGTHSSFMKLLFFPRKFNIYKWKDETQSIYHCPVGKPLYFLSRQPLLRPSQCVNLHKCLSRHFMTRRNQISWWLLFHSCFLSTNILASNWRLACWLSVATWPIPTNTEASTYVIYQLTLFYVINPARQAGFFLLKVSKTHFSFCLDALGKNPFLSSFISCTCKDRWWMSRWGKLCQSGSEVPSTHIGLGMGS